MRVRAGPGDKGKGESNNWRERERESKFIGGNTMEHRGGVPQRKFMIQHYLEVLYILERASTTKKMRSELNYKVGEARSERRPLEGRGNVGNTGML